jgi:4a-hydroxytetrahydrobiopterin dehydratase
MKLSDKDITTRLAGVPGWTVEGDALVRTYTFAAFPDAIAFVTRVAFDAEAADHHPDVTVSYRRVRVVWSTHSAGGITEKDFQGARAADAIASKLLSRTEDRGPRTEDRSAS